MGKCVDWSRFMSIRGVLTTEQPVGFTLQHEFKKREPVKEYPLFPGFEGWRDRGVSERAQGFAFFLAIFTEMAFWWGLLDLESGWTTLETERIVLRGDESLYREFVGYFKEWERLGSHKPEDFRLEFVPKSEERLREAR